MTTVADQLQRCRTAGGQLLVGGIPISRLSAFVGSTPYFAYDRHAMTRRVAELRESLGPSLDIGFAVRDNPMPAVVQHLADHVDCLEVASAGEMAVALDTGMPAERVSFAAAGKTDDDLSRAVAAGVLVELDSDGEARRLARTAERVGVQPRAALRISADSSMSGARPPMSGMPEQFGVDVELAPALLDLLEDLHVVVEGFRFVAPSQQAEATILGQTPQQIAHLLLPLAGRLSRPLTYFHLGAGFAPSEFDPDFDGDVDSDGPLAHGHVGDSLRDLADRVILPAQPYARVVVEVGQFLVRDAGVYVTRVIDRKAVRGRTYLVVDGGTHHLKSGRSEADVSRNYSVVIGNRADELAINTVDVVSCVSTSLDVLACDVLLPDADVGDYVVVFQAAANSRATGSSNDRRQPGPVEVLV